MPSLARSGANRPMSLAATASGRVGDPSEPTTALISNIGVYFDASLTRTTCPRATAGAAEDQRRTSGGKAPNSPLCRSGAVLGPKQWHVWRSAELGPPANSNKEHWHIRIQIGSRARNDGVMPNLSLAPSCLSRPPRARFGITSIFDERFQTATRRFHNACGTSSRMEFGHYTGARYRIAWAHTTTEFGMTVRCVFLR
jgi:hypothetical protein